MVEPIVGRKARSARVLFYSVHVALEDEAVTCLKVDGIRLRAGLRGALLSKQETIPVIGLRREVLHLESHRLPSVEVKTGAGVDAAFESFQPEARLPVNAPGTA